jgi:hypothetical protein
LSQWANLIAQLVADDNLKQFHFNCKKAVNTPVNSRHGGDLTSFLSDLSNKFSLSYLTSFILGFVQQVFSLLFAEFYSLCYLPSFILGFGEFSLEEVTSKVWTHIPKFMK